MKRLLTVTLALLACASSAMADHISIYSDASGASCRIEPGFTSTSVVIHKFTLGATQSRWRIDTSALVGTVLAFNSPYATVGSFASDITVNYGTCVSSPTVLGTLLIDASSGKLVMRPALNCADILYEDCSGGTHAATGWLAAVTTLFDPCGESDPPPIASRPSTWGYVKALYR